MTPAGTAVLVLTEDGSFWLEVIGPETSARSESWNTSVEWKTVGRRIRELRGFDLTQEAMLRLISSEGAVGEVVNIGADHEITIEELAHFVSRTTSWTALSPILLKRQRQPALFLLAKPRRIERPAPIVDTRLLKPVSFLVTHDAESYQILGRVIAETAPRLNVMDLKIFRSPADLATPAVPLQDFMAELTVGFSVQLQAWPFGSNCSQGTT